MGGGRKELQGEMKLSIIIPTYNEERTIGQLIRRILATSFPIDYEMVIIDDHSGDRTYTIERELRDTVGKRRIRTLRNRVNKGKGASIRQGLKHARGDLVIIQDGDLEYDPSDIPKLLEPILAGRAEVVYGSRFLKCPWPSGMVWSSYAANHVLTWLTNLLYGTRLTDMETCYKMMRRRQLVSLRIRAGAFEFEPEVTAKLARQGVCVAEVPISYHGRTRGEGKKIRAKDFFIALWALIRYRL